ncbi:acyl carrier protein, partial [Streptomyces sp. NPDC007205]|uniref:acyl carrier protein n=1 Tax=Streptomyces sp. NPDC007205 TaxID=3154316 RepID=UPI0033E2DFC8
MQQNNEDRPDRAADPGQRLIGEAIERGTSALSVADLLARALPSAAPATPPPPARTAADDARPKDVDELASAIATLAGRHLDAAVGPETDFFEAGGTSVGAVELVASLARELGVELTLDDVFADARPRRLAERWLAATGVDDAKRPMPAPRAVRASTGDDGVFADARPRRLAERWLAATGVDDAKRPMPAPRAYV